jgi:hypothetical protein
MAGEVSAITSGGYYDPKRMLCVAKSRQEAPAPAPAVASAPKPEHKPVPAKTWQDKIFGTWGKTNQGAFGCGGGDANHQGQTIEKLNNPDSGGIPLTPLSPDASGWSLPPVSGADAGTKPETNNHPKEAGPETQAANGPEAGPETQVTSPDTAPVIPPPVQNYDGGAIDGGDQNDAGSAAGIDGYVPPVQGPEDAPPQKPEVNMLLPQNQLFDVMDGRIQKKTVPVPVALTGQGLHNVKNMVVRIYSNPRLFGGADFPCVSGVTPTDKDLATYDNGSNNIPISLVSYTLTDKTGLAKDVPNPLTAPVLLGAVCGNDKSATGSYIDIAIPAEFYDLAHADNLNATLTLVLQADDTITYVETIPYDFRLDGKMTVVNQ